MMDWDWNRAHDMTGWMWAWMGLWMLLVIAGIVALIVFVARAPARAASRPANEEPLDVLKRRFAAGEIDEEEFERRREILAKS